MLKLTNIDGQKFYLNPTYIESFNDLTKGETHIFCTGASLDDFYRVKESPEEILTLIYNTGEKQ